MSLELLVASDLGECPKTVLLDSSLKGSSSSDSNFGQLLQEYTLDGKKILGTKAVVVDMGSFVDYLSSEYHLSEKTKQALEEQIHTSQFKTQASYWTFFWDRTSEIHHRDIMRFAYQTMADSIREYRQMLDAQEPQTEQDLENAVREINTLDRVYQEIAESLQQLYEAKLCGGQLSPLAHTMLLYAQGFQLSSESTGDKEQLWKSRILRLQMHSGITKDQQKYAAIPESKKIQESTECFLGSLLQTEIRTPYVEIPFTHAVTDAKFAVSSTKIQRSGKEYYSQPTAKELKVRYTYH